MFVQVCDGRGNPCDNTCGGAGCGKCGGISCGEGAVSKATNAMDFSKRADLVLQEKHIQTRDALAQACCPIASALNYFTVFSSSD